MSIGPPGVRHVQLDSSPVNGSPYIAVCGASDPDPGQRELAREVGRRLAEAGAVVLCGGLGGVPVAASPAEAVRVVLDA